MAPERADTESDRPSDGAQTVFPARRVRNGNVIEQNDLGVEKGRRPNGVGGEEAPPGGRFRSGDGVFGRGNEWPVEGLFRRGDEGRRGAHPGADERGVPLGMVLMLLVAEGMSLHPDDDQTGREKINQRKEKGDLFKPHSGHMQALDGTRDIAISGRSRMNRVKSGPHQEAGSLTEGQRGLDGRGPALAPEQGELKRKRFAESKKHSDKGQGEGQGKGLGLIRNGARAGEETGGGVRDGSVVMVGPARGGVEGANGPKDQGRQIKCGEEEDDLLGTRAKHGLFIPSFSFVVKLFARGEERPRRAASFGFRVESSEKGIFRG